MKKSIMFLIAFLMFACAGCMERDQKIKQLKDTIHDQDIRIETQSELIKVQDGIIDLFKKGVHDVFDTNLKLSAIDTIGFFAIKESLDKGDIETAKALVDKMFVLSKENTLKMNELKKEYEKLIEEHK